MSYRVNDDGTVSVRRNGVWLPFEEYERVRDNELASALRDVEELNRQLEDADDKGEDEEPAEVVDDSPAEWQRVVMEWAKKSQGGSIPNSSGPVWSTTTGPNSGPVMPPITVSRGGVTYTSGAFDENLDRAIVEGKTIRQIAYEQNRSMSAVRREYRQKGLI